MVWRDRLLVHMEDTLNRKAVYQDNILIGFAEKNRQQAVVEYFLLSPEQQTVLARYLTKPKYTHSYLL